MSLRYLKHLRWISLSRYVITLLVNHAHIGQVNPQQPIGDFLTHLKCKAQKKIKELVSRVVSQLGIRYCIGRTDFSDLFNSFLEGLNPGSVLVFDNVDSGRPGDVHTGRCCRLYVL